MAISIKDVSLKLGDKEILRNVTARFRKGELTIILGPNGTGKSSLLKLITQELESKGDITLHDKDIKDWSGPERASFMGVLPQSSDLSFAFNVREVVEMGGLSLAVSQKELSAIADEQMRKTEVYALANRLYPTLSGGEKQRVHLARVLTQISRARHGTVLLLDEPTAALDLSHQHNTLKLAKNMAEEGASVIAVIHDLNLAAQYADRIMILNSGFIMADGSPKQVITKEIINRVYRWPVDVFTHPERGHPVIMG
ncbi:heme ABC transporter ATP-binding protein [Veronia nyctiphanis]|uniref:Heme ABC transporter ATP-binding protein n=1 Tax=Veronia nyctiphanis TaxID=1278244 RepID=A0A4Q0YTC7_9GAMM|nr:heme ABC transporter ATP-binding protein [Veronia nyctiphanis]RXJ74522.1 heme ABC transporter ATP-binding protein [Veronia nyctiphanis]